MASKNTSANIMASALLDQKVTASKPLCLHAETQTDCHYTIPFYFQQGIQQNSEMTEEEFLVNKLKVLERIYNEQRSVIVDMLRKAKATIDNLNEMQIDSEEPQSGNQVPSPNENILADLTNNRDASTSSSNLSLLSNTSANATPRDSEKENNSLCTEEEAAQKGKPQVKSHRQSSKVKCSRRQGTWDFNDEMAIGKRRNNRSPYGVPVAIPPNVELVALGPNGTQISSKDYENIDWSSSSLATRNLLMVLFDRITLATHTLTGRPSPAFKDQGKPLKRMLQPTAIKDIIFAVTTKCNATAKEVRSAITTKCADENKMMKMQRRKLEALIKRDEENSKDSSSDD